MSLGTGGAGLVMNAGRSIKFTDVNDRIQTAGGANIAMTAGTGIIDIGGVRSKGGSVNLSTGSAAGNMVVREITTTPTTGNGGAITLNAGGYASLGGGFVDARASGGTDGNIVINAAGGAIAMQAGTNAGRVSPRR